MRWSPRLFWRHMVSRLKTLRARPAPDQRPPGDLRGGVHRNLVQRGTATFLLRAPYKPYVSLVGDFNDWSTRAHPMQTDGQGTWWTTIADPGRTRYGYYVVVDDDKHVWVGDPYASEVVWTHKGPRGVLRPTNGAGFRWTDQGWRTPALRDLASTKLCVRDAAAPGAAAARGTGISAACVASSRTSWIWGSMPWNSCPSRPSRVTRAGATTRSSTMPSPIPTAARPISSAS